MFGISRQSYYAYENKVSKLDYEANFIVEKVMEIRKDHPKIGGRKLYYIINPLMESEGINLGRDKFFDVLSKYNLLIKRRIRSIRTTYSNHWLRKYSNLVKDKKVDFPNEVWVSDITYWHIGDRFLYITFIMDVYSKKVLGFSVSDGMKTQDILPALEMALLNKKGPSMSLIHHSDRGCQYCSSEYIEMLKREKIKISMTESGDPLDNPFAERINGIIKTEYLSNLNIKNKEEGFDAVKKAVYLYNELRPHLSCDLHTPNEIYEGKFKPKKLWKNYYYSTNVNSLQDSEKFVNLCQD